MSESVKRVLKRSFIVLKIFKLTGISIKNEELSLTNDFSLWLVYWQVKSQGVTEELRCLRLLNALDKNRDIPEDLAQLLGESCVKLAEGIKAYISKVSLHLELVKKYKRSVTQPQWSRCVPSPGGSFRWRRRRSHERFRNNTFHPCVWAQWQNQ